MADICQFVCSYRTPSGYCGSTGGYATCQHRKMDEPPTIKSAEPMTNADKYFRHATDEELAELIPDWCDSCEYMYGDSGYGCPSNENGTCRQKRIAWLKQEVESDG